MSQQIIATAGPHLDKGSQYLITFDNFFLMERNPYRTMYDLAAHLTCEWGQDERTNDFILFRGNHRYIPGVRGCHFVNSKGSTCMRPQHD
jgi:hypothetical protein